MDAPCIAEPPEILTLVLAVVGAARLEVRTLGKSEISGPEADGGAFGGLFVVVGVVSSRAAGSLMRREYKEELAAGPSCRGRRNAAI